MSSIHDHRSTHWVNHPRREEPPHLLLEGVNNPRWMERANCTNADPEGFFSQHQGKPEVVRAAKALCMGCEVRTACLEYALTLQHPGHGSLPGIWGGLTEPQRINLLRKRAQSSD